MLLNKLFSKKSKRKEDDSLRAQLKVCEAELALQELVNSMGGNGLLERSIEASRTDIASLRLQMGR